MITLTAQLNDPVHGRMRGGINHCVRPQKPPTEARLDVSSCHRLNTQVNSSTVRTTGMTPTQHDVSRQQWPAIAYLVYEVDLGVGGQVSQQVHGPVQVVHGGHLPAHTVVQPPRTVVVDEAVPNPQACTTARAVRW